MYVSYLCTVLGGTGRVSLYSENRCYTTVGYTCDQRYAPLNFYDVQFLISLGSDHRLCAYINTQGRCMEGRVAKKQIMIFQEKPRHGCFLVVVAQG